MIQQKSFDSGNNPSRSLWRVWEVCLGLFLGFLTAVCFYLGVMSDLENRTIDLRFQWRGALPLAKDMILVVVDDESLAELGPWPWPRAQHGKLARTLKQAGAKVVGFDMYFNEPSSYGPEDDATFTSALKEVGNVLLPVVFEPKQVWNNQTMEFEDRNVAEVPMPELRKVQAGEGFIDMEFQKMNPDGVLRYAYLEKQSGSDSYNPFGVVLAARFLGSDIASDSRGIWIGERLLKPFSSFMINYANGTGFFNEVPYQKVLTGNFPEGLFKGKAVMVGTRTKGTSEDRKFCPFGILAGMEVHAHLFQTIVSGRMFTRLPPLGSAILLVGMALVVAVVLARGLGMVGNLFTLALFGSWIGGAFLGFQWELVLEIVPVVMLLPMQWAVTRLIQQFVVLRQRNRELNRINTELEKRVRELSILNKISEAVNFMGNLSQTLDDILKKAVEVLGAQRGSMMLLDERYENLVEQAVIVGVDESGEIDPELKEQFKIGEGIAGEAFMKGVSRLIPDVSLEPEFKAMPRRDQAIRSIICVPLKVKDTPIGVVNIVNKLVGTFNHDDLELANTMANQAAIVIEKARLYNLATIDGLTGLSVHRHFQSKMEEEFRRAKRYEKPLSMIMTDIDHFKKFNDTWGHQTGDLVLREVAKCVRLSIRDTDMAARYGGEEFAVILPETDMDGAALFAERLRQKVEIASFTGPKGPLKVTISLGVSSIPYNSLESTQEMIKAADEAMYEAKHTGRNKVGLAPPPSMLPPNQTPPPPYALT